MKRILVLTLAAVLLVSGFVLPASAAGEGRGVLYVSPDGNDSADGSFDRPLKTLQAARNKVRSIKNSYEKGVTVYVRGGNYNFAEPLIFTEEDSGKAGAPITYRAYEDETVTITGGVTVNGNSFRKVTDEATLNRLIEKSARENLYALDLKTYGIRDLGLFRWRGSDTYSSSWSTTGRIKPETPNPEVFMDGVPLTLARYPDSGFAKTGKVINGGSHRDFPNRAPLGTPFTIEFKNDRLEPWSKIKDTEILMMGYWEFDWSEQTIPIGEIDLEKRTITGTHGGNFGVSENRDFYVYNILEELSIPGEYYIDYNTLTLYLIPPGDLSAASIMVSALEAPLVQFNGASYINLRGLDITGARSNAVYFDKASSNNEVSEAEISFTAGVGVFIEGTNNGVRNSYIHDVDGAVELRGGDRETVTDGNCYAINNEMERYARITTTYKAAVQTGGVQDIASHNEIHDGPHLAIQLGGIKAMISYNDVYDVLNAGNDAGVVYAYLNRSLRGNRLMYNYIHDCVNENIDSNVALNQGGIVAFYLDGGFSDVVMVGNVVANFAGCAVAFNGGRDNVFANNIVVDCVRAMDLTDFMVGVSLAEHDSRFMEGNDYLYGSTWREAFPRFSAWLDMEENEKKLPVDNVFRNNIIVNTPLANSTLMPTIDIYLDYSQNYLDTKDPGFVDMSGGDFNLKQDALAYEKLPELKGIPFTRMGRLDNLAESRTQNAVAMAVDSGDSYVNGEIVSIDENPEVVPFIRNDLTYIPLRFLAESLGASVDFQEGKVIISSETVNLEMQPGSTEAKKNGEAITLQNPSMLVNDRTMVPLREVSELLDKKVFWHDMGFISISDDENLFLETDSTDVTMIHYLYGQISQY